MVRHQSKSVARICRQSMLVPSKSIQVSKTAASQYMLKTSRGETALVNTADELIKFDDYLSFVSLSAINTEGSMDDDDELSFVREKPMEYLATQLYDGSHTTISPILISPVIGINDADLLGQFAAKFVTPFTTNYAAEVAAVMANLNRNDGNEMAAKARQQLLNTDTYIKIGNTMYCIFDDFGPADSKAWTAFYKGTGPLPTYNPEFTGDICCMVEALDKAAADPEVKNFVLDLTCNNGGELGVLQTVTALLAGKTAVNYENVLTKQRIVNDVQVDANFDRVFDLSTKMVKTSTAVSFRLTTLHSVWQLLTLSEGLV